ncbi:FAD-dependent oxidoreductase [Bacillus marinisedimentorum]|uniref:FAD-dependent oxidoreductase n=1 Tax=Bacillus marinisedimentorum TaxID=1821260 RepID=UPI0008726FA0|nr:FAD-dependent oxidoreductase [Bacillus marinisedimentorum]
MSKKHEKKPAMPRFPEPYWRENMHLLPEFEQLDIDLTVDIAIVGGGITGITAAYLLTKNGFKTALIEAGNLLNGTTGHTTAKVTAQHGLIYDELIQHFGEIKAQQYYQAAVDAMDFIKQTAEEHNIDCDLTEEDAYLYATTEEYKTKLQKEHEAYKQLGINGRWLEEIPFDIKITGALAMEKQMQFHPLKYLAPLVSYIQENGGLIYEKTTAVDVEENDQPEVILRNGKKITCKHVVAASHYPFYDGGGLYFTRMHPDRSYIIAVKAEKEYPGGMYLSVDNPVRSLRFTDFNGEKLILIAGENHKTGQGIDTMEHYKALEQFGQEVLGIKEYPYRWSAQDLITLDKIPYIGQIKDGHPNIYVAAGYRKWGMTNGTQAALLITDLIMHRSNQYLDLYSPSRDVKADPAIKKFIKENTDVAGELIAGKLDFNRKRIEDMEIGEGAIVTVNGQRAGAYKENESTIHIVDTTCRHMGCEVKWNAGDRTWDCPCHGSRYSADGTVVEGPAEEPLPPADSSDR